jgi:uridine phosphorylase
MVEASVRKLARKHATIRFIKLHYLEAEMENAGVPALLAYRGGEKFAGLVPVVEEIQEEQELTPDSLEEAMRKYVAMALHFIAGLTN